jgi:hypothetical protein
MRVLQIDISSKVLRLRAVLCPRHSDTIEQANQLLRAKSASKSSKRASRRPMTSTSGSLQWLLSSLCSALTLLQLFSLRAHLLMAEKRLDAKVARAEREHRAAAAQLRRGRGEERTLAGRSVASAAAAGVCNQHARAAFYAL